MMKRIMSIQDISCVGKCSLTVALPVISAMGIETSIVPTAVLSTHTQFSGFTFRDLTEDMIPVKEHWKKENFKFDAIYTGYLGSERQVDIVIEYFDTFKSDNTKIIVDPAMADNGKLYTGFDKPFAEKMSTLCGKADIVLPNISEACLMLDLPYPGEDADEKTIEGILIKLAKLGAKVNVITGTQFADGTLGYTGYIPETGEFFRYGTEKINYKSHGTGDVFASAFTGAFVNGHEVKDALMVAADYTCACIRNTYNDPDHVSYAVNFEKEIPYLLKRAGII